MFKSILLHATKPVLFLFALVYFSLYWANTWDFICAHTPYSRLCLIRGRIKLLIHRCCCCCCCMHCYCRQQHIKSPKNSKKKNGKIKFLVGYVVARFNSFRCILLAFGCCCCWTIIIKRNLHWSLSVRSKRHCECERKGKRSTTESLIHGMHGVIDMRTHTTRCRHHFSLRWSLLLPFGTINRFFSFYQNQCARTQTQIHFVSFFKSAFPLILSTIHFSCILELKAAQKLILLNHLDDNTSTIGNYFSLQKKGYDITVSYVRFASAVPSLIPF